MPNDQQSSAAIFIGTGPQQTTQQSVIFPGSSDDSSVLVSAPPATVLFVASTYVPVSYGPREGKILKFSKKFP